MNSKGLKETLEQRNAPKVQIKHWQDTDFDLLFRMNAPDDGTPWGPES